MTMAAESGHEFRAYDDALDFSSPDGGMPTGEPQAR